VRLIRLYTEEPLNVGSSVSLKKNFYHYLSKVLRAKENQAIVLFDNSGFNYFGYVKNITSKSYDIFIEKKTFHEKTNSHIEIAFSVCKNPCSDMIIQKLTELGIDSIQPIISTNSIFNQKKINSEKKISHWKNISVSSSEQSERNYLPNIQKIISYQEYIEKCKYKQKIILDTKSEVMLPSIYNKSINSSSILVGPEGDFTDEEYIYAKESNFSSASLGDNILRVETAAISAFSYIKIINNSDSNE
tara:strand:+ start:241 stop:978 length:738 start_codon:yes stop_codon:yes gene_type:complete